MLCRACGMQNNDPSSKVCQWCKKPLSASPPEVTIPFPPPGMAGATTPPQTIQRTSLTGEVVEVPLPYQPGSPMSPAAPGLPPTIDPNRTVPIPGPSRPGASYASMHAAGASYNAMAPQMLRDQERYQEVSLLEKWELFLAIACPALLLSCWLVHSNPASILWVSFVDLFGLSLALGGSGAVPSYSDAYFDVAIMLVVTFLFGPIIALAVYLIVALIKQECNTAVVGLLALQIVLFQGLSLAFVSSGGAMKQIGSLMMFGLMNGFAVFVAFLGWLLSSFFRPVGE